jgi:rhodanese-related sulfurtransferase
MSNTILPRDLKEILDSDVRPRLIDVRTADEFCSCHIPGAQNIPLDRISDRLPGVEPGERVVMICQGGFRSETACARVSRAHSNLFNLIGGVNFWLAEGFTTESGADRECVAS